MCYRILTVWMIWRRIVRNINKIHVIMEDARKSRAETEMIEVGDEQGDAKGSEETTL